VHEIKGGRTAGNPRRPNYAGRVDVLGYAAIGVSIACLIALAALGRRAVRIAVAAFVLVAVACYGLFLLYVYVYGRD
jgi:uncharacterized membrane protein